MAQRYGTLGRRLQDVLSRGVLKARIDAADRRISISATEERGILGSHQQLTTLIRELNGIPAGAGSGAGGVVPPSSSGRGSSLPPVAIISRFASRFESMDALSYTFMTASGPNPKLVDYFARMSPGLLTAPGVGRSRPAEAAVAGRATFCSEAGASTASRAVPRGSMAKNLTRWTQQAGQEKSQSLLMYLLAMVVAVVGVTYASVPLYRRFCQATGYGGTVQRRETVEEKIAKHGSEDASASRELVVHFNADVADSMPWKFTPCQQQIRIKVGESSLAFYTAENISSEAITGVSTYNVAPMQAGAYFNKIQCFCFEEQRLRPGEKIDMPVLFYVDPEFAADPKMDSINSLILSYTFFKVEDEEDE